jgi:MSHA biogenesis protein MshP
MLMKIPTINNRRSPCQQSGSALLLALFVMIVLMLFGTSMMELLSTSSETVAQEVIGTRALAAANSAMQAQLQQLFPLDGAAGVCVSIPPTPYSFTNINGLNNCQAVASCGISTNYDGVDYYRLTSTGTCGSGSLAANSDNIVISSRTVQVEAKRL